MFREHHARNFGVISRGEEHEPAVVLVNRRVLPCPDSGGLCGGLVVVRNDLRGARLPGHVLAVDLAASGRSAARRIDGQKQSFTKRRQMFRIHREGGPGGPWWLRFPALALT